MAAAAVGSFRAGLKRGCQYLVGKSPSFTPIRQMGTLVTSRGSRHVRTPPHLKMSCLTTCGNVGVRWLCSDSTPRVKKVQGRKKWVGSVAMVGKGRIFHVAYPILKVMGLDPHVFTQVPDRQDVRQHKMRGDESVEELEVLLKPYDAVLNLACQYNGETWKPARREEIYDTNTELASRIAEAASQQDKPCILMSSRASKYPGIDSVHHPYAYSKRQMEERVKHLPGVCTVVLDTAVYANPEDEQDSEALGIETLALVPHTPVIQRPLPAIFGVTAPRSLIQPVAYDQISRALAQQLTKMICGVETAREIAFAGNPVAIQEFVHDVNSSKNPLVVHVHPGDETIELIELLRNSTGFFQKEIHELSLLPGIDEITLDTEPFEELLAEIGEELPTSTELATSVGQSVQVPLLARRLATAFMKCPAKMRLAYLAMKLFVNAKYSIGPYMDAPSPHSK